MEKSTTSTNFARTIGKQREDMFNKLFDQVWWRDLVSMWRPSGQHSGDEGLRMAIRNGYINFYRCGQSIAKVEVGPRKKACLSVNLKYVQPRWHEQNGVDKKSQFYVAVSEDNTLVCPEVGGDIGKYGGREMLKNWVRAASSYAGEEKIFVDQLMDCNPNVIDVEMALPLFINSDGVKAAPRMDLVAIENKKGIDTIVFWEAKMMRNGEERAEGDKPPPILTQLKNYETWLGIFGHKDIVSRAYKENCETLIAIHVRAKQLNPELADLGSLLVSVAQSQTLPQVDTKPRVVIRDPKMDQTWVENGHDRKLINAGYFVQLVQAKRGEEYVFNVP